MNKIKESNDKNDIIENLPNDISDSFYFLPPSQVCEAIVDSLHYPAVIISSKGEVLYKNKNKQSPASGWRTGAALKRYVSGEIISDILKVKSGDYVAININNNCAAVFKINDFYFILFLSELEKNGVHIENLYNYMLCMPEKLFFERFEIQPDENNESIDEKRWKSYKKKFQKTYNDSMNSTMTLYSGFLRSKAYAEHEIFGVLENLKNASKKKNMGLVFKLDETKTQAKRYLSEFWFKCDPKDLGIILGTITFLCLQCGTRNKSGKTVIKIDAEKNQSIDSCLVTFGVKSDIAESELDVFFRTDVISDERALYLKTAKTLAMKYFWGIDVNKTEDGIAFRIFMHYSLPSMTFGDSMPCSSKDTVDAFIQFISSLLDE